MEIRVNVGGWEHECCGDAYELNDLVNRDLYLPMDGPLRGDAGFWESHHGGLSGGVSVTGRVVGVDAIGENQAATAITRLPSGSALTGVDEDDRDDIIDLASGAVLNFEPEEFVVTLDVADGSELPTERPRSSE